MVVIVRMVRSILLGLSAVLLATAASATPTTYTFSSGSVVVRGTLAGQTSSIFEGSSSIDVPLVGVTAVFDSAIGSYGRLESLSLTAADFSIDLDESLVSLDGLNVYGPTITSLSGSDLNLFGQFSLPTAIAASVTGQYPNGDSFGPVDVESLAATGSAAGLLTRSGDDLLISIVGVTLASFAQPGATVDAPLIQIKADFTLIGQVAQPVPEPTAALLFAVGLGAVQLGVRRAGRARD